MRMKYVLAGGLALVGGTCSSVSFSQQPFVLESPARPDVATADTAVMPERSAAPAAAVKPVGVTSPAPSPFFLAPVQTPAPQSDRKPEPTAAQPPIEAALRYYASINDVARVAVEIRRLQMLHPGWQPPADLMTGSTTRHDEQPLWDVFSTGNYDEVQAKIAEIQGSDSDWQPSKDLSTKLANALARRQMFAAFDNKQWGEVLAIAGQNNALLVCSDVDSIWHVAEALVQVGDTDRAFEAYRYVLANCPNPQERLATVQKAQQFLAPAALDELIAMGRRRPDGTNEFASVKMDVLRRKIGETISDATLPAPAPADLDALSRSAAADRTGKDAQLLGWYFYSRKDYASAQTWFAKSMMQQRDGKTLEGLVLSLRGAGKLNEAEEAAFAARDLGSDVRKIFVEIVSGEITATPPVALNGDRLARFAAIVDQDKSSLGAQALGWSLYNQNDLRDAQAWFQKSVSWGPTQEGVVGLAISAQRNRDLKTFQSVLQTYRATFPRVADLEKLGQPETLRAFVAPAPARFIATRGHVRYVGRSWNNSGQNQALALFQAGKYNEALGQLERMRGRNGSEDPGMKVLRGWALYHTGDWAQAKTVFAEVSRVRPSESTKGLMVIEQREQPRFRQ